MMMIMMIMIMMKITKTIMISITITITNVNVNVNMNVSVSVGVSVGVDVVVDMDMDMGMNMMTATLKLTVMMTMTMRTTMTMTMVIMIINWINMMIIIIIMIVIIIMIMITTTTTMMTTMPTTPPPTTTTMTMMMLMVYEMPGTNPATSLAPQWLRSSEDRNGPIALDEIFRSEWRAWPCFGHIRTWIILGLEADNTLKSIFQIRWHAIVQTDVNIIIIWWTVTYNGITWQWRKIPLYDSYIQVEQFSLLATAKLIYWTTTWMLWVLTTEYNRNIGMRYHYGNICSRFDIWCGKLVPCSLFCICLGVYKVASYISFITSWSIHGLDHC